MSPTPRRKWYLTTGRRAYLRNEKKNCQKEMHFMFQIGPKLPLYILIYIYTNETYIYSRLLRIGCIQVDILKSQRYRRYIFTYLHYIFNCFFFVFFYDFFSFLFFGRHVLSV